MRHLLYSILFFTSLLLLQNCNSYNENPSSFITTLGNDTLVIEQFTMLPEKVEAEVMIRTPRTHYFKQTLLMEGDGSFQQFHSTTYSPDNLDGAPIEEQTIEIDGDSLVITVQRDAVQNIRKIEYNPDIIPWIDMVHWPYEVATRHMVRDNLDSVDQVMLTGRNTAVFEIRKIEDDSVSVKHPFRGTMYARIDDHGAIQYFDATSTTRKLVVIRGGAIDMMAMVDKFEDKPIGSLSGEGRTEASVHGANIVITFGQPVRRGRELFGGIVPWNERWRTGANRATHFTTDKNLRIGELEVPAGEYTLFTIPAPDGGILIINRQTGQNGRSYDESRDLGRVEMNLVENDESVELFTIDAVERGDKGVLQLKWGETIFEVEFVVAY